MNSINTIIANAPRASASFRNKSRKMGLWGRMRYAMTLIETTVVLIIATAAIAAGGSFYAEYLNNLTNKATADQLKDVSDSFAKYIQDNYAPIIAALPASKIAVINFSSLQPDYLDSKFVNQNPFGQSYVFTVRQPDPLKNILEAIVYTTGGEAIPPNNASAIAQMVGAGGGYTKAGGSATAVISNFNGYTLDLSSYSAVPSGSGKLVSAIFMNETGVVISDYLYRNAIPNRPELNRMNTALDMNSNNINNAGNVTSPNGNIQAQNGTVQGKTIISDTTIVAGGNITSSGGAVHGVTLVSDTTITAGTNIIAGGDVSAGTANIAGSASVGNLTVGTTINAGSTITGSSLVSTGGVTASNDITTSGGSINATNGNVHAKAIQSDTTAQLGLSTASLGGGCTTGTIGLDNSGRLLSCVSGTWSSTAGTMSLGPMRQAIGGGSEDYTDNLGSQKFCALSTTTISGEGICTVWTDGTSWFMRTTKWNSNHVWCQAVCLSN